MTTKQLTCIECPKGCNLSVDIENCEIVKVRGARCPKGIGYAVTEIENPSRIFTSTVLTEGLELKLVSVRTNKPIPKKDLFRAAEEARKITLNRSVEIGDVVADNFLGLGVKLIATRSAS
jgi:CxxC motif-containing protein